MTAEFDSRGQEGGKILLLPEFQSEFVHRRNVVLWLPPGYESETGQRYPVIYAQDGQNLFDPQTSFAGVDWGIREAIGRLLTEGTVRKPLVVGIWNTPERYREYDPQKVFEEYLSPQEKIEYAREYGRPLADSYLKFIVQELKPFIDSRFRTLPATADTFLMGSSMGGMLSAYALCEFPEIFGAAACLSTHWPAVQGKMADYLADRLPDPQTHRLYFDYGTETVDTQYEPFQRVVDDVLRQRGYVEGSDWVTQKFYGEDHSEQAWRRRVDIPLRFLLK
ncbi:alpha/beta hydrolase [Trichloromonas sp.]|uniref:alpha/beta hydrolase n=1 Tax=Trichloromonas sp. TaxID=3069249 RepID=UPI003D815B03